MAKTTRVGIGRMLEGAFDSGPASRDDLVSCARANGADADVVSVLEGLNRPSYRELRELWGELHHLPVGSPQSTVSS